MDRQTDGQTDRQTGLSIELLLAPRSAHALPSAQPPIETNGNCLRMCRYKLDLDQFMDDVIIQKGSTNGLTLLMDYNDEKMMRKKH